MPVIAQYRFKGQDLGLLAVLYPGVRVLRDPHFPEFIPDPKVIVVSDVPNFTRYPQKEVVQITRFAVVALDTKRGFLAQLPAKGVKATNYQIQYLLEETSDEDFWKTVKLAILLKRFPTVPQSANAGATVLDLYDKLFEDFEAVYRIFTELCETRPPKAVLSVLLDMTAKAKNPRAHTAVRPYYRRILKKNHRFGPLWSIALQDYLRHRDSDRVSRMEEEWGGPPSIRNEKAALLNLFAACSAHTRPEESPWFKREHCFEWNLRRLGYDPAAPEIRELFPGAIWD